MEVKNIDGFSGLYATKRYQKGDVVVKVEGPIVEIPNRYSVQIKKGVHVDVDAPCKFINHHCQGNIVLEGWNFIALRTIEVGDEICFNYNHSEDELAEPFVCKNCGQEVRGKLYLEKFPCKLSTTKTP